MNALAILFVHLLAIARPVHAWGGFGSSSSITESDYGNVFGQDWLYDSSGLSMKVEGCVWADVEDNEDVGCLQDESEDGTTNWYMMANCKRPQVVFSVYSNNGCNSGNFKSSFVTSNGLSEFIYYLQTYDQNSPFNNDDDDGSYDADGLPVCEQGNNGYLGLDCGSNGNFVVNYFEDEYCNSRTGNTYNSLSSLNNKMGNYKSCNVKYSSGSDVDASLIHQLVFYSEPCSSYDFDLCRDNELFQLRSSSSGYSGGSSASLWSSRHSLASHKSWVTKLKYAVGGLFLLASFVMFTGILFTNRRRRRAMMMRKYRQSKKQKSREKSRDNSSRKSGRSGSKSRRSKSKTRDSSKAEGVFT